MEQIANKNAPAIVVGQGKLKGNYKPVFEADEDTPKNMKIAWRKFFDIKLEAGEKKRISQNGRTLKQNSCYWT